MRGPVGGDVNTRQEARGSTRKARAAGLSSRWQQERGAAAVEFAIVALVFVTLVLGLMQYGWYFFQRQQVEFGAREGARHMAVEPCDDIAAYVDDKVNFDVTVATSFDPSPAIIGGTGTVTVTSDVQLDLGLPLPSSTMTATATTRIEQPGC